MFTNYSIENNMLSAFKKSFGLDLVLKSIGTVVGQHMNIPFLMTLLYFELPWMACSGCGIQQIKMEKNFLGRENLYADIGE